MPEYFKIKVKNICPYCECKGDIVWRNLFRAEPHFDACFRHCDDKSEKLQDYLESASSALPGKEKSYQRCFLKCGLTFKTFRKILTSVVYTLRVPFLARKPITLSLVHHVRAEGKDFVPAKLHGGNQEKIFGFIAGFTSAELGQILTETFTQWQDINNDHLVKATAKITPRLFIASVLSQYGWIVAQESIRSGRTLIMSDGRLQLTLQKLVSIGPGSSLNATSAIAQINTTLINIHAKLAGADSTFHYLAESANALVNGISTFEKCIQARLAEWKENHDSKALEQALHRLDSCTESIRDEDKLKLVRNTMKQYEVDIQSLQQRIHTNVEIVSHSLRSSIFKY